MNILSIDTTSMTLSCAITSGDKCVAEFSLFTEKTHSERLMPLIDSALKSADMDISDIDYYACTIGPGSFTGLRIGISTIKGLAYANDKKIVAISSLDALFENVLYSKYQICPLIDARKGEVFFALYSRVSNDDLTQPPIKLTKEVNIRPEDIIKKIRKKTLFLGNGAYLYKDMLKSGLGDKAIFAPDELNYIKGLNIAKLAMKKINDNDLMTPDQLVPKYIRKSDAEC